MALINKVHEFNAWVSACSMAYERCGVIGWVAVVLATAHCWACLGVAWRPSLLLLGAEGVIAGGMACMLRSEKRALRFASFKSLLLANNDNHHSTSERLAKVRISGEVIHTGAGGCPDCFDWRV